MNSEDFVEGNRLVLFPPDLEERTDDPVLTAPKLEQREKQQEIDRMEIHKYEENGDAQVRFRDILFACVQRAYKNDNPSTAFRIDTRHQEVLSDETKAMSAVAIKTSHYLSALRIAQAYRAHKFRNHFIERKDKSEQKYSEASGKRDTREAFADDDTTAEESAD